MTARSNMADAVLSALQSSGVRFAVLHDEDTLATGEVSSDVDLVVDTPMRMALPRVAECLADSQIRPVVYWPYDLADTATVFFFNAEATTGVQIDTLHDPDAVGKFGIRSNDLLARLEPGISWPRIERLPSLLYQVRKRHWKGQNARIQPLTTELAGLSTGDIQRAAATIFEPATARMVLRIVNGADPIRFQREGTRYRIRNLARKIGRLGAPIGAWVEFDGDSAAEAADSAAERFGRVLPVVRRADRPRHSSSGLWYLRQVAPVRWRPGLVVGVSGRGWPTADLFIEANDGIDAPLREMVIRLADHMLEGLGGGPGE